MKFLIPKSVQRAEILLNGTRSEPGRENGTQAATMRHRGEGIPLGQLRTCRVLASLEINRNPDSFGTIRKSVDFAVVWAFWVAEP